MKDASSGVVGVGGHKKLFVGGEGTEGATTPPPPKILTVHTPVGCIRIPLSQFLEMRPLCTFSQFH